MPLKQKNTGQHNIPQLRVMAEAASYRLPMPVVQVSVHSDGRYPICPRCDSSFDREYMQFCDRCGQRLSWKLFIFAATRTARRK